MQQNNVAKYITIKQAAAMLSVCVSSIRKLIDAGTLPSYNPVGRAVRIRVSELEALMRPSNQKPAAVPSTIARRVM
jgi:excisionase family DNA binding protein